MPSTTKISISMSFRCLNLSLGFPLWKSSTLACIPTLSSIHTSHGRLMSISCTMLVVGQCLYGMTSTMTKSFMHYSIKSMVSYLLEVRLNCLIDRQESHCRLRNIWKQLRRYLSIRRGRRTKMGSTFQCSAYARDFRCWVCLPMKVIRKHWADFSFIRRADHYTGKSMM